MELAIKKKFDEIGTISYSAQRLFQVFNLAGESTVPCSEKMAIDQGKVLRWTDPRGPRDTSLGFGQAAAEQQDVGLCGGGGRE